jgi:hypothetical protein
MPDGTRQTVYWYRTEQDIAEMAAGNTPKDIWRTAPNFPNVRAHTQGGRGQYNTIEE